MADNKSQAQHLASLDFDISGIIETLKQVDEQTKAMGLQVGKNFYSEFQKGANEAKSASTTTVPKFVDEDAIESATQQISQLNSEYGKLAKTVESYNASGKLVGGKNTFIDSTGIETVVKYNEKLETIGQTITANYAKAEKEAEAQLKKEQALRDNFYKKNMTQIDAEIAERERQAKVFSAQIKEQMTLRAKEESEAQKVVTQIERMIEKQKQFNTTVSNQRSSSVNKDILTQSNQYISGLEQLKSEIAETGKVSEQQKSQIASYGSQIKELSGYYQEAGTKGESFLQKISDKAKWLGAFYVVNELKNGFFQTIDIIKKTEDAVVSLQRVLNDESINNSALSSELYDIAVEYGRTFEEVAEVAQQFVQAGYDWDEAVQTTRGTMLALNTAELDVTQSTEGLIAIMAQWGLQAEDYADVIDRINITADSFSVTSEKIVSALQRSSSSAKNANISLEETIGIITALAEATGRSGENIGTALNSLIIYTSKSSALETFAKNGSDAMKEVVSEYQRGAASIYDVWVRLSKELGNLTAAQQASLFNSEDYQAFADELESQAEEFTSQVSEIYGAAGTYRQNYFIALLNDMDRAQAAIEEMADAEGYSIGENQKYMESLTASWNQLKTILAELAVQAGEQGLMGFLKTLTDIGYGLASVTKSLGGVLPVLTAIGGIVVSLKAQKITDSLINPISTGIGNARLQLSLFKLEMQSATTITAKAQTAFSLLFGSLNSLVGVLGVATTAIGLYNMAYNAIVTAAEERRERIIETNNAQLEESKGLEDLVVRYQNLYGVQEKTLSQEEEFASVSSEIISILGDRAKALEGLTEGTNEYAEAIRDATNAQLESNRTALQSNVDEYEKALQAETRGALMISESSAVSNIREINEIINEALGNFRRYDSLTGETFFAPQNLETSSLMDYFGALNEAATALKEFGNQSRANAELVSESGVYDLLTEKINNVSAAFNDYIKANVELETNEILLRDGLPKTADELENLKDNVIEAVGANEEFNETIGKIIDDLFPSLAKEAEDTGEAISSSFSISQESIDSLKEAISGLNDSIDGFQSGFDTAISAIEEYNENGYLTVDTIQALIEAGGDYISMLDFTANGISLNEEATKRLLSEQQKNIDAMLQQAMTADVLETVQRYLSETTDDVESSTVNAGNAAETAAGQVSELAVQAMNGAISMSEFNKQLKSVMGETAADIDYGGLQSELNDIINRYQNLGNVIGDLSVNQSAWSNQAATAASNAAKSQTDALKKQLEAQKEAIKDRYDAEIDALKEVESENDRIREKEEYYRNRQDALTDIEKASTRSGVEYREQEAEAREKLADLDREWQQTLEDWSLDDRIAELEAMRDAEVAAIDAQIDSIESKVSRTYNKISSLQSASNKQMLQSYQDDFVDPAGKNTLDMYDNVAKEIPNVFDATVEPMQNMMKQNATSFYDIYKENFFSPMMQSINQINAGMSAIKASTPLLPYYMWAAQQQPQPYASMVTNNNQNTNLFATIYNKSAANSFMSGIFNKP